MFHKLLLVSVLTFVLYGQTQFKLKQLQMLGMRLEITIQQQYKVSR